MIHGEEEGQMQEDIVDDEAPAEDIDHDSAGEQPLQVAPTVNSVLQRFSRDLQPSKRYNAQEFVLLTDSGESESYQKLQDSKHKQERYKVMEVKMDSLKKNYTYNLVSFSMKIGL